MVTLSLRVLVILSLSPKVFSLDLAKNPLSKKEFSEKSSPFSSSFLSIPFYMRESLEVTL